LSFGFVVRGRNGALRVIDGFALAFTPSTSEKQTHGSWADGPQEQTLDWDKAGLGDPVVAMTGVAVSPPTRFM